MTLYNLLICSVICMWDIYSQKCCTFNLYPIAKVNSLSST